MVRLDLHEQEQLTKLKYLWRDWGKYIIGALIVVCMVYIANVIWVSRESTNANKAAIIFNQLEEVYKAKNVTQVYNLADSLKSAYPRAEYATMGSMIAAKVATDAKDFTKAIKYLNWVIKNGKDKGMVALSMLHLADVYIDEQKYDLAQNTLRQDHVASFDALFYIKRGDLHVVRGDLTKARDAYKEALSRAGQDQSIASSIQIKLDVLGG